MLGIPFSDRNKGSRKISQISCERGENGQPGRIIKPSALHRRNIYHRSTYHVSIDRFELNYLDGIRDASQDPSPSIVSIKRPPKGDNIMFRKKKKHLLGVTRFADPLLDPNATSICSNVEDMDSQYSKHSDEERISSELSNQNGRPSKIVNRSALHRRISCRQSTHDVPVNTDELDCSYNNQNVAQGLSSMYIGIGYSDIRAPRYHKCCGGGKIVMPRERDPPNYIKHMLEDRRLLDNIRAYNQMFAMTSFGAHIDESVNNRICLYVFKVSGQIYHWIGAMCPPAGAAPRFLQLYIYDTQNEVANRMLHFGREANNDLDSNIVQPLIHFLDQHNDLVQIFRATQDKCDGQSIPDFKIRLFVVAGAREYDLSTSNTLGAIVFESSPDTRMNYDVIIEPKDGFPRRISRLHKSYMSLQFPLLFVYGQSGYYLEMKQRDDDDKRISMNNYYMYQLHERSGLYGLLFRGGRLFQQYVIGVYCCIEQNHIDYYRTHQNDIRKDYLSGVYDALHRGDRVGSDIGGKFILPRTFTGGPRYMYSHYFDALTICRVLSNPQFFITFTCNINWPEIKRRMEDFPGLTPADRADVVVRVFEKKVHDFYDFLQHSQCFEEDPEGYKVVSEMMVHGPCGLINEDVTGATSVHTKLAGVYSTLIFITDTRQFKYCLSMKKICSRSLLEILNLLHHASIVDDEKKKKTTLTEWLTYNKHHIDGRHLSYIDFPKYYVWYPQQKIWSPRQRKDKGSIGHLVYVHPASEELFYLRMLLCHQQGCKTFKDNRIVNKVIYETYRAACEALGLLGDDKEWHTALEEAAFSSTPTELRNLFVQILIFCKVAAPKRLWDTYWRKKSDNIPKIMSETPRIPNLHINDPELQAKVLYELEVIMKELMEEKSYDRIELAKEVDVLKPKLNAGQRRIYDRITDSTAKEPQELIFVYGHGGTRKTFLWKVLVSANITIFNLYDLFMFW
ncbi:DNA helicase [Tanacetum coccineum]